MTPVVMNRALIATSWTSAGDAAPRRGDEVSPVALAARIAAVAATGWSGMGLGHADLVHARDTVGLSGLAALLADNGIVHLELEFIRDWWTTGPRRAASDRVRRDLFDAAAQLGVESIKVGAKSEGEPVDRDRFLAEFDRLATEAGDVGTRVALEATASSDLLPTIRHAIDVVTTVGNRHAGLTVDSWHTTRSGTSHAELASVLPLESVFVVELADGDRDVVGTVWNDETNQRRRPGDGVFDVCGFVVAMHQIGYRGGWGVEIMSRAHRQLGARKALECAHRSATRTLEAAEALLAARGTATPA